MAENTLQQLTGQVQRLTQRVAALEQELGMRRTAETEAPVEPSPQPAGEAPSPRRAPTLEANVGLRLVNRVGAITLILGVAFFFMYAVEKNWIGETARVLLGLGAALLLLAAGEFAFRRNQTIFSPGLTGAGAAILYLSVYAAFSAYHLISLWAAFVLLLAVTAAAGVLALRYAVQAIAILALFGGFLVAVLLEDKTVSNWFVPIYVAVLDAAVLAVCFRRGWHLCEWLALAGTAFFLTRTAKTPLSVLLAVYYALFATRKNARLFLASQILFTARASFLSPFPAYAFLVTGMSLAGLAILRWRAWHRYLSALVAIAAASWFLADWNQQPPLAGTLITLASLFLMFTVAVYSRWAASVTQAEVAALPSAAAFFFAAAYWRLAGWGDSWAAALALVLAALYFFAAYRLRASAAPNALGLVSAGLAVAFVTLAIPLELRKFRVTLAWALQGAALVWVAARQKMFRYQFYGLLILGAAVAHFFLTGLSFSVPAAAHTLIFNTRAFTAVGVAAALFLAAFWGRNAPVPPSAPAVVGHLVLLTAAALEVSDWAIRFHQANYANIASSTISILFAAYAVALVALGAGTRTVGNRYLGLLLIALVVLKLYLYDVWQLDMVYRFIAFAALGALLLTMSFVYSRYRERIASWLKTDDTTSHGASEAHPRPPPE